MNVHCTMTSLSEDYINGVHLSQNTCLDMLGIPAGGANPTSSVSAEGAVILTHLDGFIEHIEKGIRVYIYSNLFFQSLETMSRYRDPQIQVIENVCDLQNLSPNIY